MGTPLQRFVILVAASAAYAFLVDGGVFHATNLGDAVVEVAPSYFAMLWVSADARTTKYWPAFHYGYFVFAVSLVAVPHYILRTRGRAGLPQALGFVLLLMLPTIGSYAGWWLYDDLPYLGAE